MQIPSNRRAIWLFTKIRNEKERLPFFLKYYRELGIEKFFFVDNDSTDEGIHFLLLQPDCHIFFTRQPLEMHQYWLTYLIGKYNQGQWSIVVDVDELLVFPRGDRIGIHEFLYKVSLEGANTCNALLVDLYPIGKLCNASLPLDGDPRKLCRYFDVPNQFGLSEMRRRVFNVIPALRKVPLIKYRDGMSFSGGFHAAQGVLTSKAQCSLLHYKYTSSFISKAKNIKERERYWRNGYEYRAYGDALNRDSDLCLYGKESIRLDDFQQLRSLKLIRNMPASTMLVNFIRRSYRIETWKNLYFFIATSGRRVVDSRAGLRLRRKELVPL